VPKERVFLLGNPELCNAFYSETGATALMTHQVVVRTVAKTEFYLGLASEIAAGIAIDGYQHIQEDLAELIIDVEIGKALLRAAEADAEPNRWGMMMRKRRALSATRTSDPRVSQRLPRFVRKFCASGLLAAPSEADLSSPARDDIDRYLQAKLLPAEDRARLFRLAF